MMEFRWVTKALSGPWLVTHNLALLNALRYGQASLNRGSGRVITLRHFASIEERSTDGDNASAPLNCNAASRA